MMQSDKETVASNYFIANYPPFSFWKPEGVRGALAALERPRDPETPLGLYLHIPFCRRRCHFCYFKVYTGKGSREILGYLDALVRELGIYARRPFVNGRQLDFIYFGGGTPSYLSTRQLSGLVGELKQHFSWDHAREITFECEPGTLTPGKLELLRELGVTRLSLGVENFDDHVLEINGRAHRSREIWDVYERASRLDFPQVNIDLIAGMVDETEENWRRCVENTLQLQPDSITVYQMEIPFNTTIYRRMREQDQTRAPVADWPTKRRWVDLAFQELERNGYHVASAYTAVRSPERSRFLYRDQLWSGADMVALGVASFSHVGGTHFQNEHDMGPYLQRLGQGELPLHRALTPTGEERLIRELILQLKLGRVRTGYFRNKFQVDILERFAGPIGELVEEGFMTASPKGLELSREGLLQVDRLLPLFFLREHQDSRYT
jgi:oxygen-independent coproporphyrinogen-3 oxidase